MDRSIVIDNDTCIRCEHCIKVCPSIIFAREKPKAGIGVEKESNCIVCGHCVAACPTSSIVHSDFPPEKIHRTDTRKLPSPDQFMLLCKVRRSNRAFSAKPVPAAKLDRIVEAAHRAPTASNRQNVSFTIITDPGQLYKVSEFTVSYIARMLRLLGNPLLRPLIRAAMGSSALNYIPVFRRITREFAKGNDLILRKATALVLIHTPADSRFGRDDCNLAYQNGSLMAESLGVSQFYTGFVMTAIRADRRDKLSKILGMEGRIHAGMALGVPAFGFPNHIDKKDIEVTRQ